MLVYGKYKCFVIQMLYVCVLCASCGSSQCCMTCSLLMLVEDERGILRSGLMTAFQAAMSVSLLFTPSCCSKCFYHL